MLYQINPLTIAIFAFVFCNILMQYGKIFHFYWVALDYFKSHYKLGFLANPLGYCDLCFCGQIGFWSAYFMFGLTLKLIFYPIYSIFILFIIKNILHDKD